MAPDVAVNACKVFIALGSPPERIASSLYKHGYRDALRAVAIKLSSMEDATLYREILDMMRAAD